MIYNILMKMSIIIRTVAILFVIVTAVLLMLMVLDFISSAEIRTAIYKLAAICGIVAVTAMSIVFLSNNKK